MNKNLTLKQLLSIFGTVLLSTICLGFIVRASTITTINGSDTISASRPVINTNFANLNAGKAELSGAAFTGFSTFSLGASFSTSLAIPYAAGGPTSANNGGLSIDTASGSLNFYSGAERVLRSNVCPASLTITGPSALINFPIRKFRDPFTITDVTVIASGSNSMSWNLLTGATGTTKVFAADKKASGSAAVTYTSFTTSAISDGFQMNFVVTSASATIQSANVQVCGTFNP